MKNSKLDINKLLTAVQKSFCGNDKVRPILTGINFKMLTDDIYQMTATDSLTLITCEISKSQIENLHWFPAVDLENFTISLKTFELIAGNYPNTKALIPTRENNGEYPCINYKILNRIGTFLKSQFKIDFNSFDEYGDNKPCIYNIENLFLKNAIILAMPIKIIDRKKI